jgi:hypothetical protein
MAATMNKRQGRARARALKTKIPVFKTMPYPGRSVGGLSPKAGQKSPVRNKAQALLQTTALLGALEDVEGFDPSRPSNERRPALWLDQPGYQNDVRSLVAELRELRKLLQDGRTGPKGNTAKKAGAVASAVTKFIEGYADALGKGAAALTIGAAGALLFQVGLGKEMLAPILDRLRLGK